MEIKQEPPDEEDYNQASSYGNISYTIKREIIEEENNSMNTEEEADSEEPMSLLDHKALQERRAKQSEASESMIAGRSARRIIKKRKFAIEDGSPSPKGQKRKYVKQNLLPGGSRKSLNLDAEYEPQEDNSSSSGLENSVGRPRKNLQMFDENHGDPGVEIKRYLQFSFIIMIGKFLSKLMSNE